MCTYCYVLGLHSAMEILYHISMSNSTASGPHASLTCLRDMFLHIWTIFTAIQGIIPCTAWLPLLTGGKDISRFSSFFHPTENLGRQLKWKGPSQLCIYQTEHQRWIRVVSARC